MDIATRLKQFAEDQQWGNVYLGSRSDIVDRPDSEQNVEESLVSIENTLPNKVDGKHTIYKDLSALGQTNSSTIQNICSAMTANSTITYANTGNGTAYPTTNGTVVINKVTNEYCILMYNDVQTNSIYTGVFYKSASLGSPRWSGWKTYAGPLEFDSSAKQGSSKLLSSGTIYSIQQALITQIQEMSDTLTQEINTVDGRVDTVSGNLTSHTGNKTIHITSAERQTWNAKQDKITDSNGVVLAQYLPSYVDDVIEGTYVSATQFNRDGSRVTLEKDKIYLDINTNKVYRYGGSALVEIPLGVALGETSSTAYRGDRGKIAYDHSQVTGNPHKLTKTDLGLENVGNFKAVSTVANQGLTGTEQQNAIANLGILATLAELNFVDGVTSNIQTQLDSRLSLVPSKSIPSGSDLNTYTTVGTYMVGSGAISNDIANTAIPDAGYALIVCSTYGSASSTRTQFAISSTGVIRFRTFSSNSWSAWGDVFSTRNKPKASQVIEDGTHRFVTDSEKTTWNNSVDGIAAYYPVSRPEADGILDTSTDTTMVVGVSSTVNKEVYELFGSRISFVFCLQLFYSNISETTTRSQIIIASDGRIASRYRTGTSGVWSGWRKYADVDHKHNYDAVTGMSANRALVSNASGGITVSAVTSTEIGYLDGVTSSIQTQLNGKASSTHNHNGTYIRLVSQSSQPTDQNTGDLWMEPI